MESEDEVKSELIDRIARKMQFLGTHKKHFSQETLSKKTIKQLQTEDFLLEGFVRVHSDPMHALVLRSIAKKRLDPRWEPFINVLKAQAKKKRNFCERWLLRGFITHACTSDLVLQYLHTMLVVNELRGMERFNSLLWKFFKTTKMDYLLRRAPMEFTYNEVFCMKALLQYFRAHVQSVHNLEHGGVVEEHFLHMPTKSYLKGLHYKTGLGAKETRKAVKSPRRVKQLFGGETNFRKTSLHAYGRVFFLRLYGVELQ
ncbi:MAG: hypothetical protein ACYC99_03040 [Candidatus Geothermincolia bacterium]